MGAVCAPSERFCSCDNFGTGTHPPQSPFPLCLALSLLSEHVSKSRALRSLLQILLLRNHAQIVARLASALRMGPDVVDVMLLRVVLLAIQISRNHGAFGRSRNVPCALLALPIKKKDERDRSEEH